MIPLFELRWANPEGTRVIGPADHQWELEYRNKGDKGEWCPWAKVPRVVVSKREQIQRASDESEMTGTFF